jgi:tetratricopeptide (TPR) repeat protein
LKKLLLAVALAHSAWATRSPAAEGWWNRNWRARRVYRLIGTRSGLPGEEVGVVEFRTGGLARPDGNDVRVLARGRKLRPVKVLATGPGSLLRVCFPLIEEVNEYHVYYGNPEARATESFGPRRGVLLESRDFRIGQVRSWRFLQRVLPRAGPSHGQGFVPRIYFGYNPLGPQEQYLNRYTGWLVVPADGEYLFATSSDDASFLLVDGQMVCQWPGRHPAVPRVMKRFSGRRTLKKGLVKLEYWHVNNRDQGIAVAAWQPPGARKPAAIPAQAFAPVRRGRQLSYALRDGGVPVDVEVRAVGETYFGDGEYLVRARLTARFGSSGGDRAWKCSWNFGDGQTAQGPGAEHVFLRPGVYALGISASVGARRVRWTERVRIDRDMNRALAGKAEKGAAYVGLLSARDLTRTGPGDLLRMARFCAAAGDLPGQLRAARELLSRGEQVSDADYFRQLMLAVQELRRSDRGKEGVSEALRLLDAAERRFRTGEQGQSYRARVIRERGDLYYFYLDDLDRAYNEYDKVVTRFRGLKDNIVRVTKIRIGDIHRERGQYREAARRYREAESLKLTDGGERERAARSGALAQMAENYLRRRKLEECGRMLDLWEWEYPLEKLRGYSTLLRTEMELLRRNHAEVIKQARSLLRVNPRTDFAGQLLMHQARAHQRRRSPDKALECLRRIVEKYPESESVPEATRLIGRIEQQLPGDNK